MIKREGGREGRRPTSWVHHKEGISLHTLPGMPLEVGGDTMHIGHQNRPMETWEERYIQILISFLEKANTIFSQLHI